MNIEELNSLIGSDAYWQVNKKIARYFKDNNTAVLLSDLISKQSYFEKRNETVYGGFFYNTAENIEQDCNISYHKQKGCLKQLTDAGFLETIRKGLPAKLHFKINPNQIFNFLNTCIEKNSNQDDWNFKTNNNKLNNNKEITINNEDEFFEKNSPETKISDLSNNHQKEKRKKVAQKNTISNHQIIIDVYFDWFKQRNDGVPPNINAAEAKAAKMIAEYFKTIQAKKEPNTTEEEMPEKIKNMALYIFSKWDTLEVFLQKQVKLTQINSNITNIINFIKNGKQATNNSNKYNKQPVTNDTITERFKYFSEFFDRE